jgi:hypothetical protein
MVHMIHMTQTNGLLMSLGFLAAIVPFIVDPDMY